MRYTNIDMRVASLTKELARASADADWDKAYKSGAAEKPLAESITVAREEAVVMRALFGLLLEGDDWIKKLTDDPDQALETFETALLVQARLYDERH